MYVTKIKKLINVSPILILILLQLLKRQIAKAIVRPILMSIIVTQGATFDIHKSYSKIKIPVNVANSE